MLAPQQTIMRASAILRCVGAAAKLDCIWILNTLPYRGLRCANMQRRPEAKHCSSLCSQSEGDEYCGKSEFLLKDVDKEFCKGFIAFLKTCTYNDGKKQLSTTTCRMFVNYFGSSLAKAVRDGLIEQNPFLLLEARRSHRSEWLSVSF